MTIYFAAGCFHFAYPEEKPAVHSPSDYAARLRTTLAKLPAASGIEVTYGEAFSWSGPTPSELRTLADGDFFPHLHKLEVSLTLTSQLAFKRASSPMSRTQLR